MVSDGGAAIDEPCVAAIPYGLSRACGPAPSLAVAFVAPVDQVKFGSHQPAESAVRLVFPDLQFSPVGGEEAEPHGEQSRKVVEYLTDVLLENELHFVCGHVVILHHICRNVHHTSKLVHSLRCRA